MKKIATVCISLFFSLNCFAAHHEDAINLEQFSKLQGCDLDATQISSQKLNDNLYVLFGVGGNIAVSIGNDGVLIVDDQFPAMMPKIKQIFPLTTLYIFVKDINNTQQNIIRQTLINNVYGSILLLEKHHADYYWGCRYGAAAYGVASLG